MTEKGEPLKKLNEEKKPLTLEDIDKGFGIAFCELFRQKQELEDLLKEEFAKQNELIKLILKRLEK